MDGWAGWLLWFMDVGYGFKFLVYVLGGGVVGRRGCMIVRAWMDGLFMVRGLCWSKRDRTRSAVCLLTCLIVGSLVRIQSRRGILILKT
ncbi:hypothetical protein BDV36DRAFT_259502 [Aspergillus pseudocaelatus]|uniref:Transmembrane protein n=1 Tax=Aspergillus pseudocaelatus TaxID=1825620 RepID=A0ABQ6WHU7_9EURO|nr:hypothetical protein BDV36DRAFT_259502 [Aspergillus pseudocaelatus]